MILESRRRTNNKVEQKREIERELDLLRGNCEYENMAILRIKFTLDVLGYWAYPTKDGYEIKKKKKIKNDYKETKRNFRGRV